MQYFVKHCLAFITLALVVFSVSAFGLGPLNASSVLAQESSATTGMSEELKPLLEKAKEEGMSVIIMAPDTQKAAPVEEPSMTMQERVLSVRERLRAIFLRAPDAFDEMMKTLRASSPDGTWWWLIIALATALGSLIVANFVSWRLRLLNQKYFASMFNPDPKNRVEKISYLMFRATMVLINIAIMLSVALLVALIFDQGHEPTRATIFFIVVAYSSYWFFRAVVFFNIIAHDLPKHRMINLNDEDAKAMQMDWRNSMVAIIIAFAVCGWMQALGLDETTHKLFLVAAMLISTVILIYLIIKHRRAQYGIVLGSAPVGFQPLWRRVLASVVNPLLIVYLLIAWVVSSLRLLLDLPSATILVAAPSIAFFVGLAAYGLGLILIDKFYARRQMRYEERAATAVKEAERLRQEEEDTRRRFEEIDIENDTDEGEEMIKNLVTNREDIAEMPAFKPVFKPLFESALAVLIALVAIGFVLGAWDIRAGEQGNPVTAFMDTLAILFVGWLGYRAMALFIDSKLEDEGPEDEEATDDAGEGGGHGTTRLQTLLPLVRNVLLVTIVVIIGMIFLSNIGIDIAPLFAGAGVIGLAVGFGAQTLIRDIFSGGFFLFDDAFRKGEYIEVGDVRGVVEKISLRSFQLRHHNGPLHTLPFGEITQLTNYSRDWVIMKLPLRVTYDTDVERMRKLVKKLGQRLMEDPETGPLFLQPLKSQGVVQMEDSAIIVRVKFMTTPGNQWVLRKIVYAAIQDLFHQEGIKFANKEVTVRIADNDPGATVAMNEEQKQLAASAAARSVIDAEAELEAAKGPKKEKLDM